MRSRDEESVQGDGNEMDVGCRGKEATLDKKWNGNGR
jgi:hypothetical protein